MASKKTAVRKVEFSNLKKLYFPSGFTKGEMIQYYLNVAPFILPHLKNRPVTLIRFPDGVKGESFYEKNAPAHRPDWVKTFPVERSEEGSFINYILINDAETLAWCANLGAIELHPFLHRAPNIHQPTHVAFDLDPGEGSTIFTCIEVAFLLKELFDSLGLEAFPKVSGSKGLQLYVPLNTKLTYAATSAFAKTVAELMERQHTDLVVSKMAKLLRKGKVMIDWSQNSETKTTVSVYSLRGKHDEPFVSMPVNWAELKTAAKKKDRDALFFSPKEAVARLKRKGDLFEPVEKLKQKLPKEFLALKETPKRKTAAPATAARGTTQATPAAKPSAALKRYAEKRDFSVTKEPGTKASGKRKSAGGALRFVIQKHAATRLHYDFRLEMNGTLKSWAVPKGLPYERGEKHAAFEVEDHPLDYMKFEGTIPKGQYGGGTVMVWDIGTYDVLGGSYEKGDIKLRLHGKKLDGEWHIFRIKSEESKPVWLVLKGGESMKPLSARRDDQSALTRRSMKRIASDNDAQWDSNR
ncbi:MAG TPA: non-homologous end-joining DNA ligase [Opitutaceae bacterium]|nr:non-homologous end-joining DNA ligase [Opitutaceae bacterium]